MPKLGVTKGMSSWFAGPKAENGDWFESVLGRIAQDYYAWRRNYFPEDGIVLGSESRHESEAFRDVFEDRLLELLGKLKADFPFQSPRYAAHMVSEQTLPSIAGYFAAMLYNPNNVSREAAPVTVRLESEACRLLCEMIGYGEQGWGHITGGGTVANLEALWAARTVAYLPQVVQDMASQLGLTPADPGLHPTDHLQAFADVFRQARSQGHSLRTCLDAYHASEHCIVERGLEAVASRDGRRPIVVVPESHHYCFEKSLDLLGMGRSSLVSVPVDSTFRMSVSALADSLDRAEQDHCRVVAVVAVVGTTEEGAVDPLDKILDLRDSRASEGKGSFWVHVDGAYGGYLRTMTRPERIGLGEPMAETVLGGSPVSLPLDLPVAYACDALERMGEADSVTIDPHKLGYVPYPAGSLCFKSDLVKPLLRQEAPYIEDEAGSPEEERRSTSVGLYILEGSKPGAAAAAVWLSHMLIPLDSSGHGSLVRQTVRDACELHSLLLHFPVARPKSPVVCVPLTPPGSNIVCYAFRPATATASLREINEINHKVYDQFSLTESSTRRVYDQKFFVSRTTLSSKQYGPLAVSAFLDALGVSAKEFETEGVFLLRSVLMNPWYQQAKGKGRHYLAELTEDLFSAAALAADRSG